MDNVDGLVRASVTTFLQSQGGSAFTLASIVSKTKLGLAMVRKCVATLEEQGVVRRQSGERTARFYIPTPAQLESIQKAAAPVSPWPVLKPRKEIAERIAAIRAAREAIPSKY
ncbi:MAG: hypothetical protein K0R43_1674 [Pseudoduganella sp.]|jgi:DNA-binding IclR family transcriptional regulator|nr:hypothetical protein [Pseudoduganella sp.]